MYITVGIVLLETLFLLEAVTLTAVSGQADVVEAEGKQKYIPVPSVKYQSVQVFFKPLWLLHQSYASGGVFDNTQLRTYIVSCLYIHRDGIVVYKWACVQISEKYI